MKVNLSFKPPKVWKITEISQNECDRINAFFQRNDFAKMDKEKGMVVSLVTVCEVGKYLIAIPDQHSIPTTISLIRYIDYERLTNLYNIEE